MYVLTQRWTIPPLHYLFIYFCISACEFTVMDSSSNIENRSCSAEQMKGGQCCFCNSPTLYCCCLSLHITERYCTHLHTLHSIKQICFLSSLCEIKSSFVSSGCSQQLIHFPWKFCALYLSHNLCWEVLFLVLSSASPFPCAEADY